MSDFISRLYEEQLELLDKTNRLFSFIASDIFKTISNNQQELLEKQLKIMTDYCDVLEERLIDLSPQQSM
jgi:hypothetical protein